MGEVQVDRQTDNRCMNLWTDRWMARLVDG